MNLTKIFKIFSDKDKKFFTQEDFEQKVANLPSEIDGLYENMTSAGLVKNDLKTIDFSFVSNQESKVKMLMEVLVGKEYIKAVNYSYDNKDRLHYIDGDVVPLNINKESLGKIMGELLTVGYENDCLLSGYGVYLG